MSGEALSIILIVVAIVFSLSLIGYLLGSYIYKRKHHLPTGDCAYCHKNKGQLLKEYRKLYGQNNKKYE